MEKPMMPRKEMPMLQRPRWWVRSAMKPIVIVRMAAAA
jgi:hypothetical protein